MKRARRCPKIRSVELIGPDIALVIFFLLSALLLASNARAASADPNAGNPLKVLTLEQLGNVEVTTASRQPEEVRKTSAAIYVLTQDDIQRSGATTIPDALRLVPGVEVAQIDSNKWSIGIRGFGSRLSRDVLVLIDGRTVYTTLLAGTYWEVQNVMLQDVDRIEVIRGPGATIWGPNAVNGVINIITKNTKDTRGGLVSAGGGNVDQGFFNARYGGGNGQTFDYRVYSMGFDRGPQFHTDGDNYDSWRAAQGGFRTDFSPNQRDSFTVQGDIYDEGAGETVTAVTYAPPYQQVAQGTELLSGGNILARWQRIQGDGKDIQVQAYYDRTNRREPNFEDLRNTFDVDLLDRFRLPARQQISWGLGARSSRGANPTIVSGLYFLPEKRTDALFTAFFQDEIELVQKRLTLTVGTKLLKTNYTGIQLQPTGRLLWTPSDKQSFWAAFTHAVRTPSGAERAFYLSGFAGFGPGGIPFFARFNANPNFRSEELNGYEAGYRYLIGKQLYFDVAAFYNHYSDLFSEGLAGGIFLENNPPPPHLLLPAQFGNDLFGTTRGIELAPEWRPKKFWRLRASYSYLEMELALKPNHGVDVDTAASTDGSSPRNEVSAQSGFDFGKAFNLDLTYRFVSALPAMTIPSYSTADVRFAWQARSDLQLSLVGRNLFQPHHFESASDPGPNVAIKRSAYAEITWQR
ncbi:MAG TPA: TonB-dependent receptor [Terriglobales bacterium]|jgi:iron complex outermembrane receptor protein|nr:TonB-dependent receptor [Terriglobales bacterium]